ncbi:MAG: hypothetical protein ACYDBH_18065 [Acidobacteriaceae bacterium]
MRIIEFYRVLARALAEFAQHGYDSKARLDYWLGELRMAANKSLPGMEETRRMLKQALGKRFRDATSKTAFKRHHPDLTQYAIQRVGPKLGPILERRILAGVDLIKLHREQSIEKVLQRFSGLVTSIPEGGSRAVEVGEAKKHIGKSLRQMRFDERRVVIDQGHKLTSAIQRTIAEEGNAIAAVWHSHWRQPGYDYREDHKERDEHVYAIRGNWAIKEGLMKAGPAGYTDEITQPGFEPMCRCSMVFLYNIRALPDDMLTQKGLERKNGG